MATSIPGFVSQYLPTSTDTVQVTGGTVQTLGATVSYYLVSNRTDVTNGQSLLYAIKGLLEASLAATTWTVQLSATSPFKVTLAHNNGSSRTVTFGSTLQAALGFASAANVVATATTVTADYPSPLWWSPDMPVSMTGPAQFDPAVSIGVPSSQGSVQRSSDGTCAAISHGVQWSAEYVFNGVQYYYKARAQAGYTNLDFETWWSNGPRRGLRFLLWRERTNATGDGGAPTAGTSSPYNFIEYFPQPDLQSRLLVTPMTVANTNYNDIRIPCFPTEDGESALLPPPYADTGPDIGPRYMINSLGLLAGPSDNAIRQAHVGDILESMAIYQSPSTGWPAPEIADVAVSKFLSPFAVDRQLTQTSSDDYAADAHSGRNGFAFFSRPGAWKRSYFLKVVYANLSGGYTGPVPAVGVRVGDSVAIYPPGTPGIDYEMGSITAIVDNQGQHPDSEGYFEQTITVDDEIQQLVSVRPQPSNGFLILFCRGVAGPFEMPRDYFMRVVAGGASPGAVTMVGAQVGDRVDNVVKVLNSNYTELPAHFESTITVNDQIQQILAPAAVGYIIFLSRPSV